MSLLTSAKNRIMILTIFTALCACNLDPLPFDKSPEIEITMNSEEIKTGEIIDLGMVEIPRDITLTIKNTGDSKLELVNSPSIMINGSNDFYITSEPLRHIDPGSASDFTISFITQDISEKKTSIIIKNNDPDEEVFVIKIAARKKSNISIYFPGPGQDPDLEDDLIKLINDQNTNDPLDLCIYGLDKESLLNELEKAIERGVRVRFVGNLDSQEKIILKEGDYYEGYFRIANALDSFFPIDGKKRVNFPLDSGFEDFRLINNNIMHNKFALFTDNSGNKFLFTGSTNFTETCFNLNNNNSLIIQDKEIVNTYRGQFEYLLGLPGKTRINGLVKHIIDGIEIDALFAPQEIENVTPINYMIEQMDKARESIHFMIFSFTNEELINKLLNSYNSGIDVKGVFDESQLYISREEYLADAGVPYRIDGNYNENEDGHGGKLHHKTMIIDPAKQSAVVITGSLNWSNNANTANDENILIIHSQDIAGIYEQEWQKRWEEGSDANAPDNEYQYDHGNFQDIIINEVMWMGSRKSYDAVDSSDEFIELKNITDRIIDLNGWAIYGAGTGGKIVILNKCEIKPDSYIVILNSSTNDSAFQPADYIINSGLSISNDKVELILKDPMDNIIDYAGDGAKAEDFAGHQGTGNGSINKSMARKKITGDGKDKTNWFNTETQVNINTGGSYILYNLATPGADNYEGDKNYTALDIVISEIAWAGTDISYSNEWLELFNNTDEEINLAGWSMCINSNSCVDLSGRIPKNKHFLLERTDDDSVPNKTADVIYSGGLSNSGAIIALMYNYRIMDNVDMSGGWAAGSNNPKISMERINLAVPSDSPNWQNGHGDDEGAQNSAD